MDKKEKPMSIMDRWAESEDDIVVVRYANSSTGKPLEKYNPNHDRMGRFSSTNSLGFSSGRASAVSEVKQSLAGVPSHKKGDAPRNITEKQAVSQVLNAIPSKYQASRPVTEATTNGKAHHYELKTKNWNVDTEPVKLVIDIVPASKGLYVSHEVR